MTRRLMSVVGARPQFVKAAPVSRALAAVDGLEALLVHTGQHHDTAMSDAFFDELALPRPSLNLGVHGGTHGEMTARMLEGLERAMVEHAPDMVLVYGDTNSTLAAALAAAKLAIPVAHVEAGLRSFDPAMPEEVNRVVADRLSALLFCPTRASVENLRAEGLGGRAVHVGDVMYDATLQMREAALHRSDVLARLALAPGRYAVATLHRVATTADAEALQASLDWLRAYGVGRGLVVILPLHPRTRSRVADWGLVTAGLSLIEPIGPLDMHRLLIDCAEVLTDSGGLQKEAYFHRKPCVTLRPSTEWVETIEAGWNRLWTEPRYRPRRDIADYGQGDAAHKIAAALADRLGLDVVKPEAVAA